MPAVCGRHGSSKRAPLTREQAAHTARAIIATHQKALGFVSDADKARTEAQAHANMTPLAQQIIDVPWVLAEAANRAGVARARFTRSYDFEKVVRTERRWSN